MAFEKINKKIAELAIKKFCGHLWYLGEAFVPMSLFNLSVPIVLKQKMVVAVKYDEGPSEQTRRIILKPKDAPAFAKKELEEFASMNLFRRFGLPTSFFSKSPTEWESLDEYKRWQDFFNNLAFVNDVAERAVALIQEYHPILKTEAQKQNLLQTVKKFAQSFPRQTGIL